jgi:putative membrane protein
MLGALFAVGLAQARDESQGAGQSGAQAQSEQGGGQTTAQAQGNLSEQDREFLMKAAQANMAEIQTGQLAQQKAASDDVKQFGQHMVQEHGKALQELQTLAQKKGVDLPQQPDKDAQKTMQELQKLSGKEFDEKYIEEVGVKSHREAAKLFQRSAERSKDPEVRAFAAEMLPDIKQHQQMAQKVEESID